MVLDRSWHARGGPMFVAPGGPMVLAGDIQGGSATSTSSPHPPSRAHLLGAAVLYVLLFRGSIHIPSMTYRSTISSGDLRDEHSLRCDDRRRHGDRHLRRHDRRFRPLPMARSAVLAGAVHRRPHPQRARCRLVLALGNLAGSSSTTAYSALSEPSGPVLVFMWLCALISLSVKDPRLRSWPADLEGELHRRHEVLLISATHTHALRSPTQRRPVRGTCIEPAAQRLHTPRHPAQACPTQR
jgi:hypothetical protein